MFSYTNWSKQWIWQMYSLMWLWWLIFQHLTIINANATIVNASGIHYGSIWWFWFVMSKKMNFGILNFFLLWAIYSMSKLHVSTKKVSSYSYFWFPVVWKLHHFACFTVFPFSCIVTSHAWMIIISIGGCWWMIFQFF